MKRREFIKRLVAIPASVPLSDRVLGCVNGEYGCTGERVLVVIELAGGADGLSMLIPVHNETYFRSRPNLAIPLRQTCLAADDFGFHPELKEIVNLYESGKVAVIQGVSSADSRLSHFAARSGWWAGLPARRSRKVVSTRNVTSHRAYPDSVFGAQLQTVFSAIASGGGNPVYHAVLEGFDTHVGQAAPGEPAAGRLAALLSEYSQAICAFREDLVDYGIEDKVLILSLSEFGRSVSENRSYGTEHGFFPPVLMIGDSIEPGIHGEVSGLASECFGEPDDRQYSIDIREFVSGIADGWLDTAEKHDLRRLVSV